ncbi:hypothetical protein [Paenibacillus ginsengarvi]|uniref:Uncharacterized protein n=1 Tax=Paenibacillus ginsengarvi TaxID=400777 RepID=A0A3B0CT29_9BACL|nr:hypothetical protein [Paenibacillus ginsengarvi]RKN86357.1 hypothetical protein D7M11_04915 [Paenibacillus ginsengarvi]
MSSSSYTTIQGNTIRNRLKHIGKAISASGTTIRYGSQNAIHITSAAEKYNTIHGNQLLFGTILPESSGINDEGTGTSAHNNVAFETI